MASVDLITSAGAVMATGKVAWAGSASPLSRVPWIPKAGTPLLLQDGRTMNPVWDRAIRWLFEEYIGGIQAPTVASIASSVTQTQTQVVAAQSQANTAQLTANSAAAAVNTTRQVLVDDGTPGADQIPPAQPGGIGQFEP